MAFNKKKTKQYEDFISSLLDSCDSEVIVLRDQENLLYMNVAAQNRMAEQFKGHTPDLSAYIGLFPMMVEKCCSESTANVSTPCAFDTEDIDGKTFSVICNSISWIDNRPATIYYLRNVDEERKAKENLFKLAYFDHLTGIANRQKFKEDFDAQREAIESGKLAGIVSIFDLDNFKTINDTYGHNTGDVLLRRLTEFLEGDPELKGHLYRLGGDEFVFFFVEDASHFKNEAALKQYFQDLLQVALRSYTLPNIEHTCTLSIGVAQLPQHGTSSSELLRKADIALYKAKAAGRNQLVFFEAEYDTAKKFKDLYINIQPILMSSGRTFGYELIDNGDTGKAKEDLLQLTEFDRTIDALGLEDLQNDIRYFIHDSSQLLSTTVQRNLPKDKFVIQVNVPEKVKPKDLEKYTKLYSLGYSLLLSNLTSSNATPELIKLASYCKFQLGGIPAKQQQAIIQEHPKKVFIATKVDTQRGFELAKKQGFKLYQGFFFNQPAVMKKTKEISPLKANYFRLLKLTSTDDYVDFQEISNVISSDVAMSYKLLKLLNSAAMGMRSKISSITMALAYLGEENLKKWIAMLAIRGIAEDKPLELVRLSLIRAQFGELLAPHFLIKRESKHIFLVGLLSLLHIALEKTQEELFEEIPVSEDIKESLLTKTGKYSDLVAFFAHYEYSNWDEVSQFAEEHSLGVQTINEAYVAAVKWYNDLSREA